MKASESVQEWRKSGLQLGIGLKKGLESKVCLKTRVGCNWEVGLEKRLRARAGKCLDVFESAGSV